jgi:hypothetical protein
VTHPARVPLEWMLPILGLFVALAIGLGVVALKRPSADTALRGEVVALRSEVGSLQVRLAAARRTIARTQSGLATVRRTSSRAASAGNVNVLRSSVEQLNATLSMLRVCVPQLQREVASLSVQTRDTKGWLTGAQLDRPATITPVCSRALGGP